jgi:ribosomal protein S18 acetylase RimI-like enzyme
MIRNAIEADMATLARLWFHGWQDGHAAVVPTELARLRTRESFHQRLVEGLDRVRVCARDSKILGFSMLKGDELYQFYVSAEARGSDVAPSLMADALERLRANGVAIAWLACAIGNDRATRFYEKSGWHRAGVFTSELRTLDGIFRLDVWRYEISL